MKQAILNWSGGKDSAFCLNRCLADTAIKVNYLLTTISEAGHLIPMHSVRRELLKMQSDSIGMELKEVILPENVSFNAYDEIMNSALGKLKEEGIDHSIYGDIFLEDLRQYRESRLAEVQMKGLFPLWGLPSVNIVNEFVELGFKAVIVCVNEKYLDKSFVGRTIDESFLNDLPAHVDPCGENGEYHSFVYDGPIFREPVQFVQRGIYYEKYKQVVPDSKKEEGYFATDPDYCNTGFWKIDLSLKD